jgi:hypothetical protein
MGMETLNSAARAAGFAMAASDEIGTERKAEPATWQAPEPVLDQASAGKPQLSLMDWIKGLFGASGRRAPA